MKWMLSFLRSLVYEREIHTYIAFNLKVPDTAENQVNRIRQEIRSLEFMPLRYVCVNWEPWQSMGMHKLPVDNFIVYYLVDTDNLKVTIIRIVYGGRDVRSIVKTEYE